MKYKQYSAYTAASHMVRKTKQVVMLYEGAIRYVQQAKAAIEKGDIETRFNSLTKACDIITGLQLSLDFDKGGEISKLLYDYYAGLDMRLMSIHQNNSTEMCDLSIKHLKMMLQAWEEIDHKYNSDKESGKAKDADKKVSEESDDDEYSPEMSEAISRAAESIHMTA